MEPHSALARQLARLGLDVACVPNQEQWATLIDRVSRTYSEADQDRFTLERAIELSTTEMRDLYSDLTREHETLLASQQRARAIFEHSVVGQALFDAQGHCTESNEALSKMLGWPTAELVGRHLIDFVHPDERASFAAPLAELLAGRHPELAAEQRWLTNSAPMLWTNITLSSVRARGSQASFSALLVQDITARKRLELELRHAQKLESVGRLASGIAHEINTPVQFVSDNVKFLEESMQAERRLRARYRELLAQSIERASIDAADVREADAEADIEYVDAETPRAIAQTLDGLERIATIVRAMKDFAHPDQGERAMADLNHALASTITVARNELKDVADVLTEYGDIPRISCNRGDLNQVFLNLLVNAAHAIADALGPDRRRGIIRVRTAREAEHVLISISDTGAGIPEKVQARIFEPFFTTKQVGQGTGQGLAIARSVVVDRHGGALTFTTREGHGTTFEIRLPIGPTVDVAREPVADTDT
jgi:PAS domain S-box-containing protein